MKAPLQYRLELTNGTAVDEWDEHDPVTVTKTKVMMNSEWVQRRDVMSYKGI